MFKTVSLVALGSALLGAWYCCPAFKKFPELTGNYPVGTTAFEFTDASRKEIYSSNPADQRSLMVRFFYPARITSTDTKYPYLGKKMPYFQQYMTQEYGLSQAATRLLFGNIFTHAYDNPQIAASPNKFPVVLFSHGLLGFPADASTVITENLASHGYVVAAVDHPYFNGLTRYEDGRVVTSQKLSQEFNTSTPAQQKEFQTKAINIYKADFSFVISELARINEDPSHMFYHRLDLDRIAVMGHSAGGTASIEFCRTDARCKAAINLDGWYDQVIGNEPIYKPLLLIFAQDSLEVAEPTAEYLKRKEITREQYFEREKNIAAHRDMLCSDALCKRVVIQGAKHGDFEDSMLLKWPFRKWSDADAYRLISEINKHIISFLNTNLH